MLPRAYRTSNNNYQSPHHTPTLSLQKTSSIFFWIRPVKTRHWKRTTSKNDDSQRALHTGQLANRRNKKTPPWNNTYWRTHVRTTYIRTHMHTSMWKSLESALLVVTMILYLSTPITNATGTVRTHVTSTKNDKKPVSRNEVFTGTTNKKFLMVQKRNILGIKPASS